jgi:serine/threonine protein phosphatase PrpC
MMQSAPTQSIQLSRHPFCPYYFNRDHDDGGEEEEEDEVEEAQIRSDPNPNHNNASLSPVAGASRNIYDLEESDISLEDNNKDTVPEDESGRETHYDLDGNYFIVYEAAKKGGSSDNKAAVEMFDAIEQEPLALTEKKQQFNHHNHTDSNIAQKAAVFWHNNRSRRQLAINPQNSSCTPGKHGLERSEGDTSTPLPPPKHPRINHRALKFFAHSERHRYAINLYEASAVAAAVGRQGPRDYDQDRFILHPHQICECQAVKSPRKIMEEHLDRNTSAKCSLSERNPYADSFPNITIDEADANHYCAMFVIADGHGLKGEEASEGVITILPSQLHKQLKTIHRRDPIEFNRAIDSAFSRSNEKILRNVNPHAGSTASLAFIHKNQLFLATVGDSRCVVYQRKKPEAQANRSSSNKSEEAAATVSASVEAIYLLHRTLSLADLQAAKEGNNDDFSINGADCEGEQKIGRDVGSGAVRVAVQTTDHHPNNAFERTAIEQRGGFVMERNGWRVNGILNMSRSMGDRELSHVISAQPSILNHSLLPHDSDYEELLVMASDGLWVNIH